MVIDSTIQKIFSTIIEEVKEKYGKEYSTQHIYEVVNFQIEATKIGFVKKTAVFWEGFFKFIFIDTTARQYKRLNTKREILKENEYEAPEVIEQKINEMVYNDSKRKGLLRTQGLKSNSISAKELLIKEGDGVGNGVNRTALNSNLPLFKNIK